MESIDNSPLKMAAINRHLFDELGYSGDHDEYYDPRNSYLNQVFERRLGNPISLALVQMEVARRLGIRSTACPSPATSWCACRWTTACW